MIIEATGLTKEFARARGGKRLFTAVHPLDIGLEERQLTLVSGHSGSGKSTLANMLAGILTLENGKWLKQNTTTYIDILKFISSSSKCLVEGIRCACAPAVVNPVA